MNVRVAGIAAGDAIVWIKNLGQQLSDRNDVMGVKFACAAFLSALLAAHLATEVVALHDSRAEALVVPVVENRLTDSSEAALIPVGVSASHLANFLQPTVALSTTCSAELLLRRNGLEVLPADGTRFLDSLSLRNVDASHGAILRDFLIHVEVDGKHINRLSADFTRMKPLLSDGPLLSLRSRDAGHSFLTTDLRYGQYTTVDGSSCNGVNSGNPTGCDWATYGNPEPSLGYTPGRCRDYRRGLAPLITGKSAPPEREEIVRASGKPGDNLIAEIQSATPLREGYTAKMGYSITATVEGDATLGLVSLGNGFSQLAGTVGVDPSDDDLLQATQFLADADAPDDGELTFWMSPACYTAIQKIDKFTRSNYVGQAAAEANVRKGALGEIYGAQIFRSSLARNNPSSADTSYNWFFHKRAVALVMQQMPTVHSQYIILEDGWGVYVGSIYNFCERAIPPSTTSSPTSGDQLAVAIGAR